jgi:CRP-like cAMP-binding protein
MALSSLSQGSVIYKEGDSLSNLALITNGSVEAVINGRPFRFAKGDMIGLCDLSTGKHSHTYTAISDANVFSHACESFAGLDALLRDNADVANLMVNSMLRHISETMQYRAALKKESDRAYELLLDIYRQYAELCASYKLTSKKLHGMSGVAQFSEQDPVERWADDYYTEIKGLDPAIRREMFYNKPGISSSFLRASAEDIHKVYQACKVYREYVKKLSVFFLKEDEHDLFALISDLHFKTINIKGADAAVQALMTRLTGLLSGMTGIDSAYYMKRLTSYKETLSGKRGIGEQAAEAAPAADSGIKQNLSDSLDIILNYSECPEDLCERFARSVRDYTNLFDSRGGVDPEARRLRMDLTVMFYEVYQKVFIKSLNDPAISTIIKMFLNFGYVDATLAGLENADHLYSIADSIKGDPSIGVYTLHEWLTAIQKGEKEPSRSESDLDYDEHIREMKKDGKIDAKDEVRLLGDLNEKLRFELENVFPIINKITFGRISTYCPLFADHNIQRKLEASLVTPSALKQLLDEILAIDPGAYCREISYTNQKLDIANEYLHVEVLPDIILMPNVGTRGSLWQEIEGKNRRTPARMFMSMFLDVELKAMVIRLTGEFRWEMCKRVQGIRWNDIANPSLTGDYCGYLQFYKGNRELSAEIKESIRDELASARNNYKAVFVSNYSSWLLYESVGAARLNKLVRDILLTYCPFSPAVREELIKNPRYTEILNRYNMKQKQRVQRMMNLIQRVSRMTKDIPRELQDELEYVKRN